MDGRCGSAVGYLSSRLSQLRVAFSFAGDRHVIADAMNQAVINHHVQGAAIIRPRERRPVPVVFQIALITDHRGKYLQWTLTTRPSVSTESQLPD